MNPRRDFSGIQRVLSFAVFTRLQVEYSVCKSFQCVPSMVKSFDEQLVLYFAPNGKKGS